jgi:hypothetical protein
MAMTACTVLPLCLLAAPAGSCAARGGRAGGNRLIDRHKKQDYIVNSL